MIIVCRRLQRRQSLASWPSCCSVLIVVGCGFYNIEVRYDMDRVLGAALELADLPLVKSSNFKTKKILFLLFVYSL